MKRLIVTLILLSGFGKAAATGAVLDSPDAKDASIVFVAEASDADAAVLQGPDTVPVNDIFPAPAFAAEESSVPAAVSNTQALTGDARAREILEKITAVFLSLGAYSVEFEVGWGDESVRGRYGVEGEKYYIVVGDAEVYGDGKVRYEVDNRRREVTIDKMDTKSRNILNNPVHAFDFIGDQYTASLVGESGNNAGIRLTPTQQNTSSGGVVLLTVNTSTMHPESLNYDAYGEQMPVVIINISKLGSQLKTYSRKNYPDYEIIDFR